MPLCLESGSHNYLAIWILIPRVFGIAALKFVLTATLQRSTKTLHDDIGGFLGVIEMKGLIITGPMYFVFGCLYLFSPQPPWQYLAPNCHLSTLN